MNQITLDFHGKQVSATLNRDETDSGAELPRSEAPMWYVSIGGTALTKLPALPGDTEASLRERIVAWLEKHPDMLDRDQIILGGG